jgi:hypothetical protein
MLFLSFEIYCPPRVNRLIFAAAVFTHLRTIGPQIGRSRARHRSAQSLGGSRTVKLLRYSLLFFGLLAIEATLALLAKPVQATPGKRLGH